MVDLIGVEDLAAGAGMLTLPDTVGLMIGASSGGTVCMAPGAYLSSLEIIFELGLPLHCRFSYF